MTNKKEEIIINFSNMYDEEKFKELVLYVADKCSDDPDYGAVKLNKILFYSEFQSYGKFGEPITKMPYFHLEKGPAPKYLKPIREQMIEDGEIAIQEKPSFRYTQHRIVPLREANLDKLKARDIAIVDEVINALCGVNADTISKYSYFEVGYCVAQEKEDIPYETVFLSNLPLTKNDVKRGFELAKQYEWAI